MLAIRNKNYKQILVQKLSRIKVHNSLAVTYSFILKRNFGPLENRIKTIGIDRGEIFQKNSGYTLLYHNANEILEDLKVEPVNKTLKSYKSKWLRM
jgi:hypothetical protein